MVKVRIAGERVLEAVSVSLGFRAAGKFEDIAGEPVKARIRKVWLRRQRALEAASLHRRQEELEHRQRDPAEPPPGRHGLFEKNASSGACPIDGTTSPRTARSESDRAGAAR